jgi:hypothetical protein
MAQDEPGVVHMSNSSTHFSLGKINFCFYSDVMRSELYLGAKIFRQLNSQFINYVRSP